MNATTIVTAFFDIHRETKGDGRSMAEYKIWIKKTLQLNCNLYIITEQKFKDFFLENRPKQYNTYLKIMDLSDSYYYKYYNKITEILESEYYKKKISYPNRVECKIPEYNIIQYSKFHYLNMAIDDNPFHTDYFLWMDAGCSRFFMDVDLSKEYPSQNSLQWLNTNRFIIQKREDIYDFPIDQDFIWKADNLLYGTMFGGHYSIVKGISKQIEIMFCKEMLEKNNVNNEQLALALVWKNYPQAFLLTNNHPMCHLILFKILSL
jgi:hypothetical protein